jgi:hypothetical protein
MMRRSLVFLLVLILLSTALPAWGKRPLQEIREEIRKNGWDFSVDHNWMYDLSDEAMRSLLRERRVGLRKDFAMVLGPQYFMKSY